MIPRICGSFSNFKLVKTRSVAVLEIEIPLETADATLSALGGLPKPGAEQWVALAPIMAEAAVAHDSPEPVEFAGRKPLSLASKVALTCQQPSFHTFLKDRDEDRWLHRPDDRPDCSPILRARAFVCIECNVTSRSEITESSRAARVWADLEAAYHHWQRTGAAA